MSTGDRPRLRLVCRGVVQGVGFRPAVHRLATSLGLGGFVRNAPEGVVIEVEGPDAARARVRRAAALARCRRSPASTRWRPPRSRPSGRTPSRVLASEEGRRRQALVPPDSALCPDCRAEMEDPGDRRLHYPFTTCTNCGPRFSLVHTLPYDRERTSMACFPLCPACRREYDGSRRPPLPRRAGVLPGVRAAAVAGRTGIRGQGSGIRGDRGGAGGAASGARSSR